MTRPCPRAQPGPARRGALAAALGAALLAVVAPPAAAAGDSVRGARLYEARCGGCHAVDGDRIGPRHAGVLGRRAGSVAGFGYSPALQASRVVWTADTLQRWLADPEAVVPGQRMGYRLNDATERADIVAYLATLAAPAAR